jgi:hypothetical protein
MFKWFAPVPRGTSPQGCSRAWRGLAPALLVSLASACSNEPTPPTSASFDEVYVPLTSATTTSFQQGALPFAAYAGARDAMLAAAKPLTALGNNVTCRMDGDDPDGSGKRAVDLLAWQLTGIPAGSVVTSAKITLTVTDSSTGTWTLYGIERPWSEASATWNEAETGTPWETAGAAGVADRSAKPLGTFTLTTNGAHTFSLDPIGVARVQAWLDQPSTNNGLLLVGVNPDGATFRSREATLVSARPRLDVTWEPQGTPVPTPIETGLIPLGATWKYLDTGVAPAADWRNVGYVDTAWKSGLAELGYGDGDEKTVVGYGGNASAKFITTWFRRTFTVTDPAAVGTLLLSVKRDDGVIVYLNGTEVFRSNMPAGTVSATTLASAQIEDENYYKVVVSPSLLVAGANVLSAEVHQGAANSSDISFDASLLADTSAPPIPATTLLGAGGVWLYRDTGVFPGTGWQLPGYIDGAWKTGKAELGYGDGDEATVVSYGGNANAKFVTTWFRRHFQVTDPKSWSLLQLHLRRDDGAAVYLNGTEVMRSNMPTGTIAPTTLATTQIEDSAFYDAQVDPALLLAGENVVAVEVHQAAVNSSDISMELVLEGASTTPVGCTTPCDDANPCTDDGCSAGQCTHVANTAACNDGNACTTGDACSGGSCKPGAVASCGDNNPCTDDGCDAVQGCTHTDNTATCDDGSACTSGDVCAAGVCKGVAGSCDDSNLCTDDGCDAVQGCTHVNNSAACDDGSACTTGDACVAGACKGTGACDDGDPCTDDTCGGGVCGHTFNTAPCSDGNLCTTGDTCTDGSCFGTALLVCDDGDLCTGDVCDTDKGCTFTALTGTTCNDGSACTTPDLCTNGVCGGAAVNCDDKNPCTTDGCSATGCTHVNNTAACTDSNPCTVGDLCGGGACLPGTGALACDDNNPCTDEGCTKALGCTHAFNTVPCSDGSSCTTGDACQGGTCKPAASVACNDLNPCTDDACDAVTGCSHVNNTLTCDDGTACTTSDVCTAGTCVGTTLNCDDANACTTDSCDPVAGCKHVIATVACSDGNGCTTVDACVNGACVGSSPKDCDDGDPCTADSCTTSTGKCKHAATAAQEGLACTPDGGCSAATCKAGACVSSGCSGETWPWTVPTSFQPATQWFDPTGYHVAEITIPAADWTKYLNDVKSGVTNTYYKADVKIDGKVYAGAGIRAFGYGSMLSNPGKPNIRVNFNKFVTGLTGPESLKNVRFKASGQDATFLREPIIYAISRALGGAAPRSSWARVTVNGESYGFFIVLEHVDTDTFSAFWGNNAGNFYEENNGCVGINCPSTGCADVAKAYTLNGGTGAELVSLATAINSGTVSAWLTQVAAVADLPSFLVFYAMDVLTSNVDGMTAAGNNYDVYKDTASTKLFFIHHGMDLTFGNWSANYGFTTPWGPPCTWCTRKQDDFYARMMSTTTTKQQMWDVLKAAHCGPFAATTVNPLIDKMKVLISPDLYSDPKGIKTKSQIDADFLTVKNFLTSRNSGLNSLVGSCP